jgi:thiaminase
LRKMGDFWLLCSNILFIHAFLANLERQCNIQQPSEHRLKQLEEIFRAATRLEVSFWDMALNCL